MDSNDCRLCFNKLNTNSKHINQVIQGVLIKDAIEIICGFFILFDEEEEAVPEVCSNCLKIIYDAYELRELSIKNNEILKSYQRQIEPAVFEEIVHYNSNEYIEDDEQMYEIILENQDYESLCYCDLCEFIASNKEDVLKHIQEFHISLTCEKCLVSFETQKQLDEHLKIHLNPVTSRNKHKKPPEIFQCQYCNATNFKTKQIFHQHIKRHVEGNRYKCEKCPMTFKSYSEIYYHKSVHTTEKNFICEFKGCGKAFAARRNLKRHFDRHNQKTMNSFECIHCKTLLKSKFSLQRHLLIHDNIKQFTCSFCSKSFVQKADLIKHSRHHIGEKTYCCKHEGCNESFRLLSELRIHKEIHFVK